MTIFTDYMVTFAFISYLLSDLIAYLLSCWYVKRRLMRDSIKSYEARIYRCLTFSLVICVQLVSSVYLTPNNLSLIANVILIIFYVSVALIDLRIRIVGNLFLIAFVCLVSLWRIVLFGMENLLYYLAFAFIIYCILCIAQWIIAKVMHIANGMGMGDVKLLCSTAYLLGANHFISMILIMLILLLFFIFIEFLRHNLKPNLTIAFAPFISLASLSVLLLNL